jgi:hypothetical protein
MSILQQKRGLWIGAALTLFTIASLAQEALPNSYPRKSRLKPVVLSLSDQPQQTTSVKFDSTVPIKKNIRKPRKAASPVANRVFDPLALSTSEVKEAPAVQRKNKIEDSSARNEKRSSLFYYLIFGSLAAGLTTAGFLSWYTRREIKHVAIVAPTIAREVKREVPILPFKIVEKQKEEPKEDYRTIIAKSFPELEPMSERSTGEVELMRALQGLKLKQQPMKTESVFPRGTLKRPSKAEAKELGVGFGELELARRLEILNKKHMHEVEHL